MILVIGGRSKIGMALIDLLTERDQEVRALVRSSEEGGPGGVDTVTGDLGDVGSLRAAMSGVDKVFLLSSPHREAVRWHRNAIDAASEAGVRLLVRSSIIGADRDSPAEFIQAHVESDRYLLASGLPYVILRPNLFLQNVPESTIPTIDESGTFYMNAGDARMSMTDTRDIATVAAVALTEPGHEGREYDVTGPEALSYGDVARHLSDAMGRDVSYVDVPDDATREALLGFGMDEWFVGALVGLYQDYRRSGTDGYAAAVTDTVQRLTGRPARTLDQLLGELQLSR
jgi:uncharacterized protein YbjT (DUF2867 family)